MDSNAVSLQSVQTTNAVADELKPESRELLIKFRQQIHAVGGIWIMVGTVLALVGLYILFSTQVPAFLKAQRGDVELVLGCAFLLLGVYTCRKDMSALAVGLILSYAVALFTLVNGGKVGFLLILAIMQGHRVRGFAKKLTAEGIALTTKP